MGRDRRTAADRSGLTNVEVLRIDQFADYILASLNEPRPRTDASWQLVASRFGTKDALEALCRHIERLEPAVEALESLE